MTEQIKPPSHLKPAAAEIFESTALLMQKSGVWDNAQVELLSGYSNLIARIRDLESDQQPEHVYRHATVLSGLYGRLESMSKRLELDVKSQREAAKPKFGKGGPRRGAAYEKLKKGATPIDPNSKWAKLGVV